VLSGPKELRYYQTARGTMPFWEWLLRLRDTKTRSVLLTRLERFSEGNPGHWRSVGSGVFELKIHWGPGYRIYFGCEGPHVVILLIGGDKSTQGRDIHEAQNFWQDYQRRAHGTQRQLP
jgi:putative addiction module killer protein